MSIFSRLFPSNEMKMVIEAIKEAEKNLNNETFYIVKEKIEKAIHKEPKKVSELIKNGTSPIEWVYSIVSNISGDYVESGQYHLYRGILNPMGPGEKLLKLFDDSTDKLVEIGAIEESYAKEQKRGVRDNIKTVG